MTSSATGTTRAAATLELLRNQKVAVSVVFVAAMFMNIMDVTIVNVALPTLGREFHVQPDSVSTVAIGYLVSLAVFIPASGWLGDRFGGKRVLLTSIVIFSGASALCGAAQSLGQLVTFRILQGAGGGLMVPVGMALLFRTFPPAERVRASSILVIPTALAPALGPVLGGLFVTELSWRWVFYVNVPVGVAALVFGLIFLERQPRLPTGPFDLVGFLLAAVGLGALMYGVAEGPFKGWGSPLIVAAITGGTVLLVILTVFELRTRQPLIDVRLLNDRLFRSCTAVLLIGSAAFIGALFLVALFFQDGLGLSALQSGLNTFPEAIGVMAGAQVVTRLLYPALGPKRVMLIGLTILACALASLTLIGTDTNLWWARAALFVAGYGMSHVFVPSQAAGFATITPAATGRASTLFNALRQLGSALGVAVFTTVVATVGPEHVRAGREVSNLAAYHLAFLVAAGMAVAAWFCALTVSDADAAATIVPRRRARARARAQAPAAEAVPAAGA
jgi:EmrB/QacA subfamily drug resistance transporter